MPALFIFLLKVNVALLAFCLGYFLVLRKLTFYTLNRFYLLLAIIFSSIYPFINMNGFVEQHKQLVTIQQVMISLKAPAENLLTTSWYWNWPAMLFWIGTAVFAARLIVQLVSLYNIYRGSTPDIIQQYDVRVTDVDISPFSFWRSIFINPDKIEGADLPSILQHEQIHVNELHTLDILLAEVSVVFYWFNPGVWFIKKAINENIEFITDRKILLQGVDTKAYQYSLLNVSTGLNVTPNIANNFNITTLKKRIMMMNARKSSKINLTRYALLVPLVVISLCAFTVTKANVIGKSQAVYENIATSVKEIVGGPLSEVTIKSKRKANHSLITAMRDNVNAGHQKADLILKDTIIKALPANVQKIGNTLILVPPKDTVKTIKSIRVNGQAISINEINNGKVLVFTPAKDSVKVIKEIRVNGQAISINEIKNLPASIVEKIRVVDTTRTDITGKKSKVISIETKQH